MRLAADLISGEFNKSGLNYHNDIKDYFSNFEFTAFPNSEQFHGINLIGVLFGKLKPEEFIIFCSHYDHVGTTNTNLYGRFSRVKQDDKKDGIYNGANNYASGMSAVILLARYLAATNQNERTILFITFFR